MSPSAISARPPRSTTPVAVISRSARRRALTTTSQPASASPHAIARPMPWPEPVTTATRPSIRNESRRLTADLVVEPMVGRTRRDVHGLRPGAGRAGRGRRSSATSRSTRPAHERRATVVGRVEPAADDDRVLEQPEGGDAVVVPALLGRVAGDAVLLEPGVVGGDELALVLAPQVGS